MKIHTQLIALIISTLFLQPVHAQKKGIESINTHDLKTHMLFLASDELEGRETGEPGLNVAARYLAVQAEQLGLKPADPENGFFQHYIIQEKTYDWSNSHITILTSDKDPVVNNRSFFIFPASGAENILIDGEVVFAGYGINDEEHGYNDFYNVDIEGKVVLIMNRAPMNEKGTETQFDNDKWNGRRNYQYKLQYIYSQHPKAVLLVYDPKSGIQSIEDIFPGAADYLGTARSLKNVAGEGYSDNTQPKMVMIHRTVADQLLEGVGKSLEELQMEIDKKVTPKSFLLADTRIRIELHVNVNDLNVSNVFGMIEGSDPVLKDEVVIYLAHYDHVGTDGKGGVYNGADDNASGTVALIEIAEAFLKEKRHPMRSIGILWVSGEEIGLFGSKYFADHPLVPIEKIAAVINLDMVGRTKSKEDEESSRRGLTIVGADTVKVIGGLQSKILMDISKQTLAEMGLNANYSYNDVNHPERYFFRSDHINFARKDIPFLFYSTGTHRNYHLVSDEEKLIDYDKFLKMTRFSFRAGYNAAQYDGSIEVDDPMSSW